MKGGGTRPNGDATALQKTDADKFAYGDLYGVTCVYLAGEVRDGESRRMGVEDQA